MKSTSLGINSALNFRKEIITILTNRGYKLTCNLVSMCELVNKFNINVPYSKYMPELKKISKTYRRIKYNHKKRQHY